MLACPCINIKNSKKLNVSALFHYFTDDIYLLHQDKLIQNRKKQYCFTCKTNAVLDVNPEIIDKNNVRADCSK
jgi:hypothetical protein